VSARDPGLRRTLVHITMGGFAFALRWLTPLQAAGFAAAAVAFNRFVLPRVTSRSLERPGERPGFASGIVLYPLAVLALILVFWNRIHVAAAAWGLLAFGDGMASAVGRSVGGPRLPWNPAKTWSGFAAFVLFGGTASIFLFLWTRPGAVPDPALYAAGGLVAALAAALAESAPGRGDDNVLVPLVGGSLLFATTLLEPALLAAARPGIVRNAALGLGVNLVLAAIAWAAGGVRRSGVIAGVVLGTALYAFGGLAAFTLLLAFFVLGTAATKVGFARKAQLEVAQAQGGRRGAGEALANVGAGVVFALLALATPYSSLFEIALVAAFATAAADTVSSEIGQALGRRHVLATTFRPVPVGTGGAVSIEGTAAGIAASAVVAGVGLAFGLIQPSGALVVIAAALAGNYFESVLGASLERRLGLSNDAVNFANTVAGGLTGLLLARLLGAR
jgi:uncharacterized protein (TIGR00297 family)